MQTTNTNKSFKASPGSEGSAKNFLVCTVCNVRVHPLDVLSMANHGCYNNRQMLDRRYLNGNCLRPILDYNGTDDPFIYYIFNFNDPIYDDENHCSFSQFEIPNVDQINSSYISGYVKLSLFTKFLPFIQFYRREKPSLDKGKNVEVPERGTTKSTPTSVRNSVKYRRCTKKCSKDSKQCTHTIRIVPKKSSSNKKSLIPKRHIHHCDEHKDLCKICLNKISQECPDNKKIVQNVDLDSEGSIYEEYTEEEPSSINATYPGFRSEGSRSQFIPEKKDFSDPKDVKIFDLENYLLQSEDYINKLELDLQNSKSCYEILAQENDRLESELDMGRLLNVEHRNKIDELQNLNNTYNNEIIRLKSEVTSANEATSTYKMNKTIIEQNKELIAKLQSRVEELTHQIKDNDPIGQQTLKKNYEELLQRSQLDKEENERRYNELLHQLSQTRDTISEREIELVNRENKINELTRLEQENILSHRESLLKEKLEYEEQTRKLREGFQLDLQKAKNERQDALIKQQNEYQEQIRQLQNKYMEDIDALKTKEHQAFQLKMAEIAHQKALERQREALEETKKRDHRLYIKNLKKELLSETIMVYPFVVIPGSIDMNVELTVTMTMETSEIEERKVSKMIESFHHWTESHNHTLNFGFKVGFFLNYGFSAGMTHSHTTGQEVIEVNTDRGVKTVSQIHTMRLIPYTHYLGQTVCYLPDRGKKIKYNIEDIRACSPPDTWWCPVYDLGGKLYINPEGNTNSVNPLYDEYKEELGIRQNHRQIAGFVSEFVPTSQRQPIDVINNHKLHDFIRLEDGSLPPINPNCFALRETHTPMSGF